MNPSPQWVSVATAAQMLNVKPRAIQKRAARGSLPARKIGDGATAQWEIQVDASNGLNGRVHMDAVDAADGRSGRSEDAPSVQSVDAMDASNGRSGRVHVDAGDASPVADLRAQLERERGEVAFLRNIVEAQQRDAVELRQALKRALELAPKQLPPQAPTDAPQEPHRAPMGDDKGNGVSAPQTGTEARESAPITYASIADELERHLARQ